jgi:response regulator RpfG family c-di-GMP phosphodiesterase
MTMQNDESTDLAEPDAVPVVAPEPPRILCVDDEPNVLSALSRLFRTHGMTVRVAESGAAGIALLEQAAADVVISDMGMPGMSGAEFLQVVCQRWPETVRILLTGQADAATLIEAVNQGEISRYIAKPWDDTQLLEQVRETIDRARELRERSQIAATAQRRAEELRALKNSLEQNDRATKSELTQANERLKNNFVVSLKVFASLIESRRVQMAGHSRRVADMARKVATRLELEPVLVQEVFVAGLLHEVGKLAFSDDLLDTPVASMKPWQLQDYRAHPGRAEQLLMPLQDLRGAAGSIGAQLERFDGGGHPNHLRGRAIVIGARILAVCADYDNLQIGALVPRYLKPREAQAVIETSSGKRYDPWVIEGFLAVLKGDPPVSTRKVGVVSPVKEASNELVLGGNDLVENMVLTRDLFSPSGLMMLPAGNSFNERLIEKVLAFEKGAGVPLTIYVQGPGSGGPAT